MNPTPNTYTLPIYWVVPGLPVSPRLCAVETVIRQIQTRITLSISLKQIGTRWIVMREKQFFGFPTSSDTNKPICTVTEKDFEWNCTIRVAKTKALISCAVTAQLICAFVFAYAKICFSQDAAQIIQHISGNQEQPI